MTLKKNLLATLALIGGMNVGCAQPEEYTFLYDTVKVAIATPWELDGFVAGNKARFDDRFGDCLDEKHRIARQTEREHLDTCFRSQPQNRNAISCSLAAEAARNAEMLEDIHAVVAGKARFANTATGQATIFVASTIGAAGYTAMVEAALQQTDARGQFICLL